MDAAAGAEKPIQGARYGMLEVDAEKVKKVTSVAEFLQELKLGAVGTTLASHGITTVEQLRNVTSNELDDMGFSHSGVRRRLLTGLAILSECDAMDMSAHESTACDEASGCPMPRFNSTSSIYIDSTIAAPDLAKVCFCVSLLVHDLIAYAEEARKNRMTYAEGEEGCTRLVDRNAAFALFRPRDIFGLPGKRSRHEYETEEPDECEVPSEADIRSCLQAMCELARFSPCCLVVAVIYIERLRRKVGAQLLASTWQPTLLIATILAQKVWEDRRLMNTDFTRLCPALTLQHLNQLEVGFLQLLDYNVTISAAVYTEWYFKVCELCENNHVRLRPLSQAEAFELEINSNLYVSKLQRRQSQSGPIAGTTSCDPASRGRAILS
mmetsp:Transcript_56687/g.93738  ORF Transcript_56687/g.93738 Transcript_56687/m.93738 type:complete len:381 (+) Transcript_56687:219-1361(+)|eukprot:CAMPEP_0119316874 /NCGR_PEP_ID=MMETSP1333-20130426/41223_1 /TAXON_ID=418940 /ORGANISM="Scyphosphaera apsteinii, Strain RCC1455" /LENGTH=380 /DNA_ID=CAMNT_0007322647 /DNA_START=219 /DNA_END=1361 /DNA_ORIENTATION=+